MKTFTKLILSLVVFFSAFTANAQTAVVTFRVDMQNVTDAFTTPEVNGTFNSWCGDCWAMSDADGDNIWDVTGTVDINTDYEYKFSADTWTIQENLFAGDACTNDGSTGNVNRLLNVSADTDLGVVCWNSCDDCSVPPSHYSVTFEVDMSTCTDAYTTPEVNSTLNGWCGNCWPMTDADADGVWQHTNLVASGVTAEYKFSADGWAIQEALDPTLGCSEFITTNGYTNRQITVTEDQTFTAPWNGCNIQTTALSLQGIIDFSLSGVAGKAIHVRALQDITDLSIYGIGVANNGGGTDGLEYTFDAISVLAGEDIIVARDITVMGNYFAGCWGTFDHVLQANGNISQNGDDAIELFMNGAVVETFGDIDTDGSGESWEYMDSWAYKDASGSVTFDGGNWIFGAVNCTDNTNTIYDASCMYPICTNSYTLNMTDSYSDGWDGASWTATGTTTGTVYGPYTITYSQGGTNTETFSSSDACHSVVMGGGSFASEHSWDLLDEAGTSILSGGDPFNGSWGTCTSGCTDPNATNYDATADLDDGSCSFAPCGAPAPTHETFSTGLLPVGVCSPNQWATTQTSGSGWVFTGNPGFNASTTAGNNRTSGEFTWIDFSSTDVGVILEVEDVDLSGLTNPTLKFDYFSDLGTYTCAQNNILHVEAYDGTTWNSIVALQLNATGWNTYSYSMTGFDNSGMAQIRFRGESSGLSCDYYNDLLLDDVMLYNSIPGCMDPNFDNYDASATEDDGSCLDTYTLIMTDSWGDGWDGASWTATGTTSGSVYGPYTVSSGATQTETFSSADNCFTLVVGGGSYSYEHSWVLNDASGTLVLSGGDPYSGGFGNSVCYGCTDPLSADYDASVLFDNGSCTYPCLDADTTESFETDLGAWNQDAGDDVDWIRDSGGTPSSGTGPTTGLDGSYYLFMESSGSYLKTANLTLDCVDPTAWSAASLVFGYHMYGLTTGTLNVDVSTDNGANWTNVWTLAGDQGNVWNEATVDLSTYTSQIDVRIQGITGTSYTSDMAIDLTRLMEMPASGCTNPLASNYDATATMDDGSCTYSNCVSLTLTMNDSYGDGWNGNAFVVTDANGWQYASLTLPTGSSATATICVPDNICYTLTCGGGSYPSEVSWILTDDATGIDVLTGGAPFTGSYCTPIASGCTDLSAVNYDAAAFVDDGSCLYSSTFNVEMNCEDQTSFTTVSLESPVFGWCGGCVPMTDPDGDGVYSVTVDLPLGSFEHKYATDNFAGQENLIDDMVNGGTCAPITDYYSYANREAIIAAGHVSNDNYGSCDVCIIPGCTDTTATNFDASAQTDDGSCTYDVTFSVDLRCSGLTPTVVTATGDYDNWSGNTYNLSDADGDGIWEGTHNLLAGTFQFLYITDNYTNTEISGLINSMQNGATCAPNTDNLTYAYRMLSVGNITTSDTYASCDACAFGCMDAAASNYDANAQLEDGSCVYATTFSVNMNCEPLGSFGYVHLESPVFGWCGGCVPMTDADGDGIHTVTVDLPLGDFEYKYAVDGFAGQENLVDDMVNGGTCAPITDYYSYANRQLSVVAGASADDVYSSCDACNTVYGCMDAVASNFDGAATIDDGSCLFATTFNVDMNCQPAGSFGYVHLESPLFGWCGGCVPMTDSDGDGIHSVTVDLAQGAFEYKYAVDGFAGQEDLITAMVSGGDCAPITDYYSYANRQFNVNLDYTFGSELLSNGGFYQEGSEEVTNGSFTGIANGTDVVTLPNWFSYGTPTSRNVVDNKLVLVNSASNQGAKYRATSLSGTYKFSVDVAGDVGVGGIYLGSPVLYNITTTIGTVNHFFTASGNTDVYFRTSSNSAGTTSYTNISLKEITPSGLGWNYGSNWIHSEGIAYSTGANSNGLEETTSTPVSGAIYKVTYDVGALTQGGYQVSLGGTLGTERTTMGTYTEMITASSNASFMIMANNNAIGGVDNISVIEITNVTSVTNDVYSSCEECLIGCMNPYAWNYDSLAIADDGSCLMPQNCDALEPVDLTTNWTTETKAEISWQNMNNVGLGNDLVTNGDMSSGSNWNLGTGWSISYGIALNDGSQTSSSWFTQPNVMVIGNMYQATFTVNVGSGHIILDSYSGSTVINSSGTYTVNFTAISASLEFMASSSFSGYVDNVSCKPIELNSNADCRVWKYLVRYREIGNINWTTKSAGAGSGICNVGLENTIKTLRNLTASTTYEYKMKTVYCGGVESGYSNPKQFTTKGDCPEMTNLSVETFNSNHSKARFTWDTTGAYVFARVALRVDTAGSSWLTAGGFGVYYPTLSVNKFGLVSGESYRSQGRTFCDANITSYRSDWTTPIFWTQPGILPSRIDGGTASINNFDVYPNPSSDIFNISFVSDKIQNLNIKIVNMIGEVIYVESLEKFVGEYTKQVNLNSFTKGVYFLEITTNDGVVNKKIVLQ